MKQEVEIILSEIFGNSLNTRESVQTLMRKISEETSSLCEKFVILNFEYIDFMSRSFADELHKEITDKDFDINITFHKMEGDLLSMLKMVEKTQKQRSNITKKPKFVTITDAKTLSDYAFSW